MEKMRKERSKAIWIWVIAIILVLITTTILTVTLARYTSTSTGTGTVNVGQWTNIQFEGATPETATFNFDLSDTKNTNNNVLESQIAPGDEGSFEVTFGPAEVAYTYSLTVDNINPAVAGNPAIKFYSDEEMTTLLTPDTNIKVSLTAAQAGFTKTIYWQWAYEGGIDEDDTADGLADDSLTFNIYITATQDGPTTT